MQNSAIMEFANSDSWTILSSLEQSIKRKIDAIGTPLRDWNISINYGIKTGFNDAFIISGELKDELIALDQKSAEIIRPILRGRDIKRYGYSFADLWLINAHNGIKDKAIARVEISDYPAIKAHLDTCYEKLAKRADKGDTPYNLRNCAYMDDFSKQKIVFAETMRVHRTQGADRFPRFSFVEEGFFQDKTCFMITGNDLYYILAIINSSLMNYYIHKNVAVLDTGGFLMQKIYVDCFPVPRVHEETYVKLTELSKEIVKRRKNNTDSFDLEDQVDAIVYEVFCLTDKEIRFIQENI